MADLRISGDYPPPSLAFASLPAAASSTGLIYSVSDVSGHLFRSDGTRWKPIGGKALIATSGTAVSAAADTAENVLATITVPANIMGADGAVETITQWTYTNSADDKILRVRFSGAAGTQYLSQTATTTATGKWLTTVSNRGATNSQAGHAATSSNPYGLTTIALITSAVDTTAATSVVISGQKENSADTLTLVYYSSWIVIP